MNKTRSYIILLVVIAAAIAFHYSPAGPPASRTPSEAPRNTQIPLPPAAAPGQASSSMSHTPQVQPSAANSLNTLHSTVEANLPGAAAISTVTGTGAVTLSTNDAAPRSGETELRGKLRVVGNAPFYEFVITVDGKTDYYIKAKKSEQEGLMKHQSRTVRAVGTVEKEDLKYPNPVYNHTRHYIFPRILDIY